MKSKETAIFMLKLISTKIFFFSKMTKNIMALEFLLALYVYENQLRSLNWYKNELLLLSSINN